MEKGQNRSFKGKKDNKGCVDSPAFYATLPVHLFYFNFWTIVETH